jgi:hypothetical protein
MKKTKTDGQAKKLALETRTLRELNLADGRVTGGELKTWFEQAGP